MKGLKKAIAAMSAMVLAIALAVPALAAQTYTVTIENGAEGHTYEAYQVFTGDLSVGEDGEKILANVVWGAGVTDAGKSALGDASAKAKSIETAGLAEDFAQEVGAYLNADGRHVGTFSGSEYVISGLEPGYYLIKDANASQNGKEDAYTSYILQVVGNVSVNPKSAMPTVDKQVLDEVADAETGAVDGWGETADHAINESFQFKLIATLPADADFASYSSYKVIFNDTMSAGVTFESIASVKVSGAAVESSAYTCTAAAGQAGGSWSLTIGNIKQFDANLADGTSVEVVYNAHLNENAVSGGTGVNKNEVYLEYSNNPNVGGTGQAGGDSLGKTAKDAVWVFAYALNNTKVDGSNDQPLAGAGFRLYADKALSGEVALIFDADLNAYRPVGDGEAGVEMNSAAGTGKFNIVGLDAGSYWLSETTTPAGYNTCADIAVVISAEHAENADGTAASSIVMTVNGDQASENLVVNERGVALPSTGGMGTVVFYVAGSVLLIGACALLIARRCADVE